MTAKGLTQLDDEKAHAEMLQKLKWEKNPVGIVETHLVEAAALLIMKVLRAGCLESEYITSILNPEKREHNLVGDLISQYEGPIVDPGIPAAMDAGTLQHLLNYQRYASGFANSLFRCLHELERLQRMRLGERLPAPTALDVSLRAETGTQAAVLTARKPVKPAPRNHASSPAPVAVDVHGHDDNAESAPAESESQKVLPTEQENSAAPDPVAADQTAKTSSARAPWKPRTPTGPIWNRR